MTTEQKLREALTNLVAALDQPFRYPGEIQAALDPAREALYIPEQQAPQDGWKLIDAETLCSIVRSIDQHIQHGAASEKKIAEERPGYGTGLHVYLQHQMSAIRNLLATSPAAPEAAKPETERAELPPLPDAIHTYQAHGGERIPAFSAKQMQDYARAALLAVDSKAAGESDAPAGSGGWKPHAEQMESERNYWRARAQVMYEHQRGEVWYWQGDGEDHLESMAHTLPIVIRAEQLREFLARPQQQAKPLTQCSANRDGDCVHAQCPQLRDGEPKKSGRHCPLDSIGNQA